MFGTLAVARPHLCWRCLENFLSDRINRKVGGRTYQAKSSTEVAATLVFVSHEARGWWWIKGKDSVASLGA
jgi:hypothetical protein